MYRHTQQPPFWPRHRYACLTPEIQPDEGAADPPAVAPLSLPLLEPALSEAATFAHQAAGRVAAPHPYVAVLPGR